MKLSSCYFLLILSSPYYEGGSFTNNDSNNSHQQCIFASSFLQGAAHRNHLSIRRQQYDTTNTVNHAQTVLINLRKEQHQQQLTTFSSSTKLYGFFDRFGKSRHDDDNEEEEGEMDNEMKNNENIQDNFDDDDNDGDSSMSSSSTPMSFTELEKAKESLENLFSMPNDNQKKNKKRKSSSSSSSSSSSLPPSITTLSSQLQSPEKEDDERNDKNSNDLNHEQQEILIRTRDISLISNAIPQPPLTAIARERRLKEISLLSSLTQSDESVNKLWALWIAEKGPTAATLLLRAEQLMSVESYDEAETILWSLIHQHGVHWAEPVNRLATLKYMQGRLEESKTLCEVVLQTKPWHFGALSGIVLVCTAMNDAPGARMWADQRLPPFVPDDSRRSVWINRALENATQKLNAASKVGRNLDIGQEEIEFRTFRTKMQQLIHLEEDDHKSQSSGTTQTDDSGSLDAWQ